MSLVTKAKAVPKKRGTPEINQDEMDLALAWVRGDVTFTQASRARGVNAGGGSYVRLALSLKKYLLDNKLV